MWWHKPQLVQLEDGYWYIRRGSITRWLVGGGEFWEYKDGRINHPDPERFWWDTKSEYFRDCRFKTSKEAREYWNKFTNNNAAKQRVIDKEPL